MSKMKHKAAYNDAYMVGRKVKTMIGLKHPTIGLN